MSEDQQPEWRSYHDDSEVVEETFLQAHGMKLAVLGVVVAIAAVLGWGAFSAESMKVPVDCRQYESQILNKKKEFVPRVFNREPDEVLEGGQLYRYLTKNLPQPVRDTYTDQIAKTIDIRFDGDDKAIAVDYTH